MDDTYGLGAIVDEIADLRLRLDSAYERRTEAILEAISDGHSLREIGDLIGISHTMVANAIVGE